ncbi:hypothetical protein YYU_00985 [Anaplasma phagocytophilum str. HZ2]|nr:hypothetical protein YYU_00985 [Anaplasma phagocytophilum str. HZ2]AGR80475.1 hypothetical protein WSQ_00975 [Anaplasma phagocytophilum str. JM]AGR81733.1 hypothetical protein YYY_00990 [Anaplasma phagocytophilum str. Dog2]KDB56697.1 hypothetical protein O997_01030 [Anaplasma phagocytophilum str. MRK]
MVFSSGWENALTRSVAMVLAVALVLPDILFQHILLRLLLRTICLSTVHTVSANSTSLLSGCSFVYSILARN